LSWDYGLSPSSSRGYGQLSWGPNCYSTGIIFDGIWNALKERHGIYRPELPKHRSTLGRLVDTLRGK